MSEHWGLSHRELLLLLGEPDRASYQRWRLGDLTGFPRETVLRLHLLLDLHRTLQRIFARPDSGYDWVTRSDVALGGRSPLDRMLDGGLGDLQVVHDRLTTEAGGISLDDATRAGRRLPGTPLERNLQEALARFSDAWCRAEGGPLPPEAEPVHGFTSWEAMERWVRDGGGAEDAPIRSRIETLLVQANRILRQDEEVRAWLTERHPFLSNEPPLSLAVTPGGLRRAERILPMSALHAVTAKKVGR
ncbi:antitoxin Xre/MbcA/ParS toxin-binding domain-containing protein [Roseomonas chloroacetimidivorans]|uniref:antitoxin Xre/MbcA/ParS toxin-binding domain-containing protein n=1 Tax=Roseomonas chloroacetimidivorans TaxID=1766656 RepID=UPI003C753694